MLGRSMSTLISPQSAEARRLAELDKTHVWHPFTPMQQWREHDPLIIERGEGPYLFDVDGNRYIDGVSSLWCNVHGHRVPQIDAAVREQLDKIAHTTLLGLGSPPSIEFAAMLCEVLPGGPKSAHPLPEGEQHRRLNQVFYSDAGATAVEVGFKWAVGYWHHRGKPQKNKFIGLSGAYHGDTAGAMSVGYSELFHKPFVSMVFDVTSFPSPDTLRPPGGLEPAWNRKDDAGQPLWPNECEDFTEALKQHCLDELERMLQERADETAAVVIEPVLQGAAGMVVQPDGFVKGVAELCRKYDVLLVADEVAVGFGRTGTLFACERDGVTPDIICLAKGISAGYLPLAATVCTDEVADAFAGELSEKKTFFHGHTYTGNPLACAAAIASLQLFEQNQVLENVRGSAKLITEKLNALRDHPHVGEVRQRGLMTGIELCQSRDNAEPFDFSKRTAYALCDAMRPKGLIIRPLGDVMILMPAPGMPHDVLGEMLDIVVDTLQGWKW